VGREPQVSSEGSEDSLIFPPTPSSPEIMQTPVIHLIPHTHWDREWYLPLGGFRARLVEMVDRLVGLLEAEPGLPGFLLDGQTALLEDYLLIRPEARGEVSDLVRSGRIGTGPWYVLADEQIPSGESLLRNLALGRLDAHSLGRSTGVIYSPDAFGHPAALPAIGREFGLSRAVVWRGLGDQATGGKDLVWWRAPDGARVLLHHLPPDGYELGSNLLVSPDRLAEAWNRVAAVVLPRAASRHVAVFVGADHHAAPPDLATLPERLAEIDPGVAFRLSRLDDFFELAEKDAEGLVEIEGELRWSYGYTWTLQGTHSTRAPLKRRNARIEVLLTRLAEPLAALAGLQARRSDAAVLRRAWREVVQCHFHDAICGCCDDAVARAVGVRLGDAEAAGIEVTGSALHSLIGHDPDLAREGAATHPRLVVWNGAARARGGVVVAEATFFVRDVLVGPPGGRTPRKGKGFVPFALAEIGSGMVVAPQILSIEPGYERRDAARHYPDQDEVERVRFAFPLPRGLAGLGFREFEPAGSRAEPLEDFAAASARSIWNGRINATVERAGTVLLEEPVSGEKYPGLLRLESEREAGDCYSSCPVRGDRVVMSSRSVRPRVESAGPLVAGLSWRTLLVCGEGSSSGRGRVSAAAVLEVVGDAPALRYRLGLDNQAMNHRLRLRFPTGVRRAPALAGAQFGAISRPAVAPARSGKGEWPVATMPAHRWVAAANRSRGLAVFAPGFFEYEWTSAGDLLVTVLRSVGELSKGDLASRSGHAGWPVSTPLAQCLGEETLEFGVAPVGAADLAHPDRLDRIWEDLFAPPVARWIRDSTALPVRPAPTVALEGEGLVFSACQSGSDRGELLVRCFNQMHQPVQGAWRMSQPVVRARRVLVDGTVMVELPVDEAEAGQVRFVAGAREIVTVSILFSTRR
jgi:2-O-(6-phospho-alpha-D-mannosyl)-D-glycerate hydrolase